MRNGLILSDWRQKTAKCLLLLSCVLARVSFASGPPPIITVQPTNQVVSLLGIATFSVGASSGTTMSYQWYENGNPILLANSSSYTILSVASLNVGTYYVQVSNSGGSVMSAYATLSLTPSPAIVTQPLGQTVTQGQTVSFSVVASGATPLSYQWTLSSAPLPGATNSSLVLTNVQGSQAGNYKVVVTNAYGSAKSSPANLTVNVPAGIVTQPQSQTVVQGQTALLSVVPTGTTPLHYQWSRNGVALSGATTSTLGLTNVQALQAGDYTVALQNSWGAVTSSVATVTVTNPPSSLAVPGGTGTAAQGFSFQLSLPAGSTYVILASTDCVNWTPILTNTAPTGTVTCIDPWATNYPVRFYRALVH